MTLSAGACDKCDGDTSSVDQSSCITADESISSSSRARASAGGTDARNDGSCAVSLITAFVSTSFSKLSFDAVQWTLSLSIYYGFVFASAQLPQQGYIFKLKMLDALYKRYTFKQENGSLTNTAILVYSLTLEGVASAFKYEYC